MNHRKRRPHWIGVAASFWIATTSGLDARYTFGTNPDVDAKKQAEHSDKLMNAAKRVIAISSKTQNPQTASLKEWGDLKASVLTQSELQRAFDSIKNKSVLPSGLFVDGCHTRAYENSLILAEEGLTSVKIVLEAPLQLRRNGQIIEWSFHMANVLLVGEKEGTPLKPVVIDQGFFDQPVSFDKWLAEIRKHEVIKNNDKHLANDHETIYYISGSTYSIRDKAKTSCEFTKEDIVRWEDDVDKIFQALENEKHP